MVPKTRLGSTDMKRMACTHQRHRRKYRIIIPIVVSIVSLSACDIAYQSDIDLLTKNTSLYIETAGAIHSKNVIHDTAAVWHQDPKLNRGILRNVTWIRINIPQRIQQNYQFIELSRPKVLIDSLFDITSGYPVPIEPYNDINRNFLPLHDSSQSILYKISNLGMPTSVFLQLYKNSQEASMNVTSDTYKFSIIAFAILISISVSGYLFYRSKNRFYLYYCVILVSYISFYTYDSGLGKTFFSASVYNLCGQLPTLLYIPLMLQLLLALELPVLVRNKHYVYLATLLNIIVFGYAVTNFKPVYGDYLGYSCIIGSWVMAGIIIYSYPFWIKTRRKRFFAIGLFWLLMIPSMTGAQNMGLAEGGFYGQSLTICIILELITWMTFILYEIRESQLKKLRVTLETQELQQSINHELLQGQEKERNTMAVKLQNEVSPPLRKIMSQIEKKPDQAKKELDKIIENIRFLSRMYIAPSLNKNDLKTELLRFFSLIKSMMQVSIVLDYNLENSDQSDYYLHVNIYRLIQEAINNSITHGQANIVVVQVLGEPNLIVINVEDNGTSQLENPEEGPGLKNIRSRLDDYEYQMKLTNDKESGARLEIEIREFKYA